MTVVIEGRSSDAGQVGRSFAEAIRPEPAAKRLWFRARGETVEPWLLIEPGDVETERRLHALGALLYERFPELDFSLHILNPARYPRLNLSVIVPGQAEELPVHRT